MKIVYIKETEEKNKLKQKINYLLNTIKIEYKNDKVFFLLPSIKNNKQKKTIKCAKKLNKLLYSECISNVVLSNNLMNNEFFKNKLYQENIHILDGRKLYLMLLEKIVHKISTLTNKNLEDTEISILINNLDEINYRNIIEIAKNVKRLNIITNHIEKFSKLQDYLYNELGILIKVSNNKKKDLLSSNIIVNIDFVEELINEYKLPKKCIILNIPKHINIKTKKFNGIIINNYNIMLKEEEKAEGFENEIIYESKIYSMPIEKIEEQINMDKIRCFKLNWHKWRN